MARVQGTLLLPALILLTYTEIIKVPFIVFIIIAPLLLHHAINFTFFLLKEIYFDNFLFMK